MHLTTDVLSITVFFAPITWIRTCTCVLLDRLRRDVSGMSGVHNHSIETAGAQLVLRDTFKMTSTQF